MLWALFVNGINQTSSQPSKSLYQLRTAMQHHPWNHEREDSRTDLLTRFLNPDRHHKLIKLLPLSVPETRRVANSVSLGVVCSLLPVRAIAGNQNETVEKIEEMSMATGWMEDQEHKLLSSCR